MIQMKGRALWIPFAALVLASAIVLLIAAAAAGLGTDATVDSGSLNQNEISLALVPGTTAGQPQVLLAAFNDNPFPGGPGLGVSYSTDGGANWTAGQLSYPTHSSGKQLVDAFDPTAAADTQGNLFVGHISTDYNWSAGPVSGLYVRKSTDGGVTWQTPVAVSENGPAISSPDPGYRFNDRCQMTVDRFGGSPNTDDIYVSWIKDRGWNVSQPYSDIYFAYSTNGGSSFNLANGTSAAFPGRINDENALHDMGNMPVPAAAPDGTVYVSWMDYSVWSGGTGIIYLDKSTDGGATWGQDILVRAVNLPPLNLNPGRDNTRAKGAPVLKVSPSNSSELYLVYAEDPDKTYLPDGTILNGPDDADIHFIESTDGGATWTSPLTVNDDSTVNDQILPWMDVKPGGAIDIGWYDRRNDPLDSRWDFFVAKSTDGGASFSASMRINDSSFASPIRSGSTEGWLGEYPGVAVDGSYMYAAWTSSVSDSAGDVKFDKIANSQIACTSGKPPLSLRSASPYWASYADYVAALLSVTYTIRNSGAGPAYNVAITSSTATNSVTCSTTMPVTVGTIAAGGSQTATLKYTLAPGVTWFRATVYAAAEDSCGNLYSYP